MTTRTPSMVSEVSATLVETMTLRFWLGRDGGVLLGGRQFAMEGVEGEVARAEVVAQGVERALDFVGAGHEDEDVALGSFAGVEQALAGLGGEFPRRARRSAWADIRA